MCTVDDDESVREPLRHLLWEFGFASKKFAIADSAAAERRFP
jgi:FixJ family two-component response regulator